MLNAVRKSCALLALSAIAPAARAETVTVVVENLAPAQGVFFTPMWIAFHDGSFDLFNDGEAVPAGGGIERMAEDGDLGALRGGFAASSAAGAGGFDEVLFAPDGFPGAPVFDPGDRSVMIFDIDAVSQGYFSYASMIIPSNDAFIGNNNPMAFPLFNHRGKFMGTRTIMVMGSMVWDAGTEANTEMDAAFFNQTAPNTGMTTSEPVHPHPGFIGSMGNPGGTPIILGGTSGPGIFFDAVAADFTRPGAMIARITIHQGAVLCHVPRGNPDRAKTIKVGGRALEAHLRHGDSLGPCPDDGGGE